MAAADPGQPALLLLRRAVPLRIVPTVAGETSIGSSGQPGGADLLLHHRELVEAEPAAAELRGDVDPEEAVVGERVPQLAAAACLALAAVK